jgi:hypothetical protein
LLNECVKIKLRIQNHFSLLPIRLENIWKIHNGTYRMCNFRQ